MVQLLIVLLVLGITTLCISNLAILGVITYLLCKNIRLGTSLSKIDYSNTTTDLSVSRQTPEEKAVFEETKRILDEQEKAFHQMMNFSAEQAYGIGREG